MEDRRQVRFEVFGGFRVLIDGEEVKLPEQAYLSYLLLIVMSGNVRRWNTDDRARSVLLKANKEPRLGLGGRYDFQRLTGLKLNYKEGVGVFMEGDWTSDVEELENIWESRRTVGKQGLIRAAQIYRTGIRAETWRQDSVLIEHGDRLRARIETLRGFYTDIQALLQTAADTGQQESVGDAQRASFREDGPSQDAGTVEQPGIIASPVGQSTSVNPPSPVIGEVPATRQIHPLFPLLLWSLVTWVVAFPRVGFNKPTGSSGGPLIEGGAFLLFWVGCVYSLHATWGLIAFIRRKAVGRLCSTTIIGFLVMVGTYYLKAVWEEPYVHVLLVSEFLVIVLLIGIEMNELREERKAAWKLAEFKRRVCREEERRRMEEVSEREVE